MFREELELANKRMRLGSYLLIILAILLSVGMFLNSLTLVNQMRSLHELIPTMNLMQRIDTQMIALRIEINQYVSAESKDRKIENILGPLNSLKELIEDQGERAKDGRIKNNMIKAGLLIDSFQNELKNSNNGKTIADFRDLVQKVDRYVGEVNSNMEVERTLRNTTEVANRLIVTSFFIALLIGGGLFISMLIYIYASNKQAEKFNEIIKRSMIDDNTGLYNRQYFEQRMMESLNRVQRFGKSLAAVYVRIEIPKHADEVAHPSIMKEAGLRLMKSTRAYDVNARYSEDTFCSIIHEVTEKETRIVADRLKSAFEKKEISGKTGDEKARTGWLYKLLFMKKPKIQTVHTYVRVVIGALVCKEGKIGIMELNKRAEQVMEEAEITKDQVKIVTFKGAEPNVKEEKRHIGR